MKNKEEDRMHNEQINKLNELYNEFADFVNKVNKDDKEVIELMEIMAVGIALEKTMDELYRNDDYEIDDDTMRSIFRCTYHVMNDEREFQYKPKGSANEA